MVELRIALPSFGGQAELILSPIRGQRLAGDQSVVFKFLNDAAEIAGIEIEFASNGLGGRVFAVGEFVEHPRLAQRERSFQQVLIEHAEFARIEAGEGAYRRDLLVESRRRHRVDLQLLTLSTN